MSLLLDALKKAEKAKDEARRRAQPAPDQDDTVAHVRTRNELPDISNPLEIHSEDIPGNAQQPEAYSPVPDAFSTASSREPEPPGASPDTAPHEPPREEPRRRQATGSRTSGQDPQAAQRAVAKNVFDAKFREPNPKLPFYITMAVLGVFAVGTVVYFWYQLRPPPALVNPNAKPPSGEQSVPAAPPPQAPAAPSVQAPAIPGLPDRVAAPATAASAPPRGPGQPVQASAGASAPIAVNPKPAPAAATASKAAAGKPARSTREASDSAQRSKLSVNKAAPAVNPKLEAGWSAYNQGNLSLARTNYQEALRDEPANRDALLGMAALEVRANRPEQAEIYYQKLLESNPRDPLAQAGLFALRAQMTDPVQVESRVKSLLANDPDAHVLYFTLGNEYAQQGRWPEAQRAYFKAFSGDPENPDFAYNLAVSLDHMRQPKLALEYYRRAISLAQQRSSNFDQALARNRTQELAR